jgi:periplasmic protein TonB
MKLAALLLIASASLLLPQEILHTTQPKVIHTAKAEYTKEALDAKIQGDVILSAVVNVDGIPTDVKVTRGLGMGLDEKAVESVKQWRFTPGTSHGDPLSVKVQIGVNFRLPSSK